MSTSEDSKRETAYRSSDALRKREYVQAKCVQCELCLSLVDDNPTTTTVNSSNRFSNNSKCAGQPSESARMDLLQPGRYEPVRNGQTLDAKTRKTLQNSQFSGRTITR